jgi:hypothetical protein
MRNEKPDFNQFITWAPKCLAQIALWVGMVLIMFVLWDRWYIPGPHGPFRWVGSDFAPYWVGVREMLSGNIPYDQEVTLKIQQLIYGGPALGEDPMMFVYPAWLFLLVAPFSLLPFKTAVLIVSATFLWGLLNLLFFFAQQWGSENSILRMGWALILLLGSLPFIVISITKVQLGYLALFALFFSRRFWTRRPFWAGVFLSFAIIKPTVAVIPTVGFLLWALLERNWKYILGFSISALALIVASLLAVGNWVPEYITVLSTTGGMPVLWSLDFLPKPWQILYAAFFLGIMVYAFFDSWRRKQRDFWCSAVILSGAALFPMRWIYDLYLLILIPSEEKKLSKVSGILVGIAVMAPWCLVVLPENLRWPLIVVGLPLVWTLPLFALYLAKKIAPNTLATLF